MSVLKNRKKEDRSSCCLYTDHGGTGSEMNAGSVITNHEEKRKVGHVFADARVFPRFSILNPEFTFTLPKRQMVAGIYDMFNHICEQYFSGYDDNTSDYLAEGLMRSVIAASPHCHSKPQGLRSPQQPHVDGNVGP